MTMVRKLGLWSARLAVSAWVGAAMLFVIVGVEEVTTPEFDSLIRDRLVLLRFPWYYATGFTLVAAGWLGTLLSGRSAGLPPRAKWLSIGLLTLALLGMAADFALIYRPLEQMITPPGKPRTERFVELHRWSARVNGVNLLLCAVAAGVLNWPGRTDVARD
jgi:hypothetical protein